MPESGKARRQSPVGQRARNKDLAERRRRQISDAAMKLFAQKGYHNTTVKDIAELSHMSTGSVYDYVKNKEDILFLISKSFFDNLKMNVEKTLQGLTDCLMKLRSTIEASLSVIDNYQDLVLITYRE